MPSGRPDTHAAAVRAHLRSENRTTLDLRADAAWLAQITAHPHQLLASMAGRGVAHRIQRGRYLVNTEDRTPSELPLLEALEPIADVLLRRLDMPCYLSWHTALFHYGLLEQHASTVFCAVPARKRSADFYGFRVRFVTLAPARFFGIEPAEGHAGHTRIATLEKGLLDALERPELTAPFPVVLGAFADAAQSGMLDAERLTRYAVALERPALTRRVGFLMDRYGLEGSERLREHVGPAGYTVPLRPGGSRTEGELDARWQLRVPPSLLETADAPR
jgi:predicted transcriptional regulator of viral defense system